MLIWAGLRGAVSLAAALSLPNGLADRDLLVTMTFGVVLFTLLAQGLTIGPLVRRLGLAEGVGSTGSAATSQPSIGMIEAGHEQEDSLFADTLTDADLAQRLGVSPRRSPCSAAVLHGARTIRSTGSGSPIWRPG